MRAAGSRMVTVAAASFVQPGGASAARSLLACVFPLAPHWEAASMLSINYAKFLLAAVVATGVSTTAAQSTPPAAATKSTSASKPGNGPTLPPPPNPSGAPPKADRDMQEVLDALAALGGKPIETLTPEEARKQPTPADAVKQVLGKRGKPASPEPVAKVENRQIAGPAGQLPVRIYTPKGREPLPVIVYVHGGGCVIADLDTYDGSARALTNAAEAIVVSVEYRHAPEHKFPAAHEDVFAAYRWVLDNAASFGGDPKRVAVAGESAGGNLAASIGLMARERNVAMPVHQLLVYPIANFAGDSPSYRRNANAKPLNAAMMSWFFSHYLVSADDARSPLISLVSANLSGLPPATIVTAEIDPLRSESEMLGERLRAAGVKVDHHHYEGVAHEFFGMSAVVGDAKQAVERAGRALRRAFGM